jgi:hypothetical protein
MKTHRHLITAAMAGTVAAMFLIVVNPSVRAEDRDPANYVGPKMCGICHKKDETGNQLAKWEASPHAKAFETLGTAKAKEIAKAKGIDDPQKSGECLQCHSTAYNWTTEKKTEKIKVEEGVTCESCHGPGKKYMGKTTMEDQAKAIAAGLVHPATKSCKLCHNEKSPTFKPFDEKTYVEKIAHPNPAKK